MSDPAPKSHKLRNFFLFLVFFLLFIGNLALFPLAAQYFQEQKIGNSGQYQAMEFQLNKLETQIKDLQSAVSQEAFARKDLEDQTLSGLQRIHELHFELMKKNDGFPALWKNPGKIAYLTFDDGPSDVTPGVLDTLKKEGVKATFFVNGRTWEKDLYKRIVQEGHVLGNHTYSHDYRAIYSSVNAFVTDVEKLDQYLETLGLKPAKIYRFPGGATNNFALRAGGTVQTARISQSLAERKYTFYEWNVIGEESESSEKLVTKDQITKEVLDESRGKKIALILLHDGPGRYATAQALPGIIKGLRAQGFSFSALPQN